MSKDLILKKIGAIGKGAKKLTADIQACAVDCAVHAVQHGDVTLADQLVEALGKGMRRASLRAWFERHAPMYLPKGKDKFAFDSDRAKTMRKIAEPDLRESLMALPWEEAKPEEPVVSVFDVSEAVDKFIKRLEKQVAEANVTIKNRKLLEEIAHAASVYHAEQVLSPKVEASDKAE
jgi:hypothetical protein